MLRVVCLASAVVGGVFAVPSPSLGSWVSSLYPMVFGAPISADSGWMSTAQYFGQSVAISADGTRFVVGSAGTNLICYGTIKNGSATVSQQFGSNITTPYDNLVGNFASFSTGSITQNLGRQLDLSADGDVIAAAAAGAIIGYATSGAAVIYAGCRSGPCKVTQVLYPPETSTCPGVGPPLNCKVYGERVSLSADAKFLAVSNPKINDYAGAVYVYRSTGKGVYADSPIIVRPPISTLPHLLEFGQTVKINSDGSRLVVGAPNWYFGAPPVPAPVGGLIFVYHRDGNTYVHKQTLQAPSPTNGDRVGYRSVSISEENGKPTHFVLTFGQPSDVAGSATVYECKGSHMCVLKSSIPAVHLSSNPSDVETAFSIDVAVFDSGKSILVSDYADSGTWGHTAVGLFTRSISHGVWSYTLKTSTTNFGSGASVAVRSAWNLEYGPTNAPIAVSHYGKIVIAGTPLPGLTTGGTNAVSIYGLPM